MAVAAMKEAMAQAHVYPGGEDVVLTEKLAAVIGKGRPAGTVRPRQWLRRRLAHAGPALRR